MCSIADSFDQDLAEAVVENARRYTSLVSDVVAELLPEYKTREVGAVSTVLLCLIGTANPGVIGFVSCCVVWSLAANCF